MKSSKVFNNISDKLKTTLADARLKPGQSVIVQMLNGVPNPEPEEKERSKQPILFPKIQLMTQFRIWDDGQKNDAGDQVGGYVDVGCVDAWDGEKPRTIRSFVTGSNPSQAKAAMPSLFQGKFELRGGNVREEELYEILFLSPQREGSPCPDRNVEVLFRFVDQKAEISRTMNVFEILKKAMSLAEMSTPAKAREVMAALNQPTYQDPEVLMAKLRELSKDKPEDFIKAYESKQSPVIAIVKEAVSAGILKHDMATGVVSLGSVELAKIKAESALLFAGEFAKFLETAINGKDILDNIKSQLQPATVTAPPKREVVKPESLKSEPQAPAAAVTSDTKGSVEPVVTGEGEE